jgi:hypothetical protein
MRARFLQFERCDRLRDNEKRVTQNRTNMPRKSTISEDAVDPAVMARRQAILELRLRVPPLSVRKIAAAVKCNKETVIQDLKALGRQLGEQYETESRGMIAKTLAIYDVLLAQNYALCAKFSSPAAKAAFLRNAATAVTAKTKLLMDVGVIRRVSVQHEVVEALRPTVQKVLYLPELEEGDQ